MAKRGISIDNSQFIELTKKIAGLADMVSEQVKKNAIPKTQRLTEHVARTTAPISKTSDKEKQSKNHKAKWATTPPLRNTIVSVARDYGPHDITTFTGVQNPWGNKANFDYHGKKNRNMVFWGNSPESPRTRKKFRWMVRVNDITGKQNKAIIEMEIAKAVKDVMERRK